MYTTPEVLIDLGFCSSISFILMSMETYSYISLCSTNFGYVHYVLVCEVCNLLSIFLGSFTTYDELCLIYCALVYLDPYTACVYCSTICLCIY